MLYTLPLRQLAVPAYVSVLAQSLNYFYVNVWSCFCVSLTVVKLTLHVEIHVNLFKDFSLVIPLILFIFFGLEIFGSVTTVTGLGISSSSAYETHSILDDEWLTLILFVTTKLKSAKEQKTKFKYYKYQKETKIFKTALCYERS